MPGDWRKFHNIELYNFNSSPNITKVIKSRNVRGAGHVVHMGEMRNSYKILILKSEWKRLLGRPGRRCEGNIKMDLKEIVWEGVEWICLVQDRDWWRALVNTVTNLFVP
jgi:hypothetical protein